MLTAIILRQAGLLSALLKQQLILKWRNSHMNFVPSWWFLTILTVFYSTATQTLRTGRIKVSLPPAAASAPSDHSRSSRPVQVTWPERLQLCAVLVAQSVGSTGKKVFFLCTNNIWLFFWVSGATFENHCRCTDKHVFLCNSSDSSAPRLCQHVCTWNGSFHSFFFSWFFHCFIKMKF